MSSVQWEVLLILGILFFILWYSFSLLNREKSKEGYLFCGFVLLLFVMIYSVSVLKYEIGGSVIGIKEREKLVREIATEVTTKVEDFLKVYTFTGETKVEGNCFPIGGEEKKKKRLIKGVDQ